MNSQKNDAKDAEAICEAVTRPNMIFVPQKSVEQQDLQCLHRVRSRLVGCRTQLINQIRGLPAEYGIVLPQHPGQVRLGLPTVLEDRLMKCGYARISFDREVALCTRHFERPKVNLAIKY